MPERVSRLEKIRNAAIDRAEDIFVRALCAQGVAEVTALEYIEDHCTFLVAPGAKVWIKATDVVDGFERMSRGPLEDSIVWLAREVHLFNQGKLGGLPIPFGLEAPPAYEGALDHEVRVAYERRANSEAAKKQWEEGVERVRETRTREAEYAAGPEPSKAL